MKNCTLKLANEIILYFLHFLTKTDHEIAMKVLFSNRKIATTQSLKLLGLTIDTSLTWKCHIGDLTTGLNKACYAIRSIKPFMSLDMLDYEIFLISFMLLYLV